MAHAHGTRGELPANASLIVSFLNTYEREYDRETLDSPAALTAFYCDAGLAKVRRTDDEDVTRAVELREAIRDLVIAKGDDGSAPAAVKRLDRLSRRGTLTVSFRDGSAAMEPAAAGADAAIARIALTIRDAMVDGTWERIKVCAADDCRWAFYDRSRNRSRAWCEMQDCGNRAKVRAFRERHSS